MTLGAFGVLTFLERRKDGGFEAERFGAFAGTGFKHPALGAAMALFMVALAGMPPTGGFFGKLYLFSAALEAGDLGLGAGRRLRLDRQRVLLPYGSSWPFTCVTTPIPARCRPRPGSGQPLSLGAGDLRLLRAVQLGLFPGGWIDVAQTAIASLAS